jgi:hypothetical protein
VTKQKKGKLPEIARYRYKIRLDVEGTKLKAESKGFFCRLLEGLPKNKRGKDGIGEFYPLPQYEITGKDLPANVKIELAPGTTQIYVFGEELKPPLSEDTETFLQNMNAFLDKMEVYCQQVEEAEEVMNSIAVFLDADSTFCMNTRIYTNIPARYRLIIRSQDVLDKLLTNIEKAYLQEIDLVYAEIFRGNLGKAQRRIDLIMREIDFFAKSLIETAREMNDPRANKWEAEFNKLLQPSTNPPWFK